MEVEVEVVEEDVEVVVEGEEAVVVEAGVVTMVDNVRIITVEGDEVMKGLPDLDKSIA